jgi:polysaccharide pyruvyl transferase WcaK-like protein
MTELALFGDYATTNFGDLLIADLLARSALASGACRVRVDGATRELCAESPAERLSWWSGVGYDRAVFGGGGFLNDVGPQRVARFRRFERLTRSFVDRKIPFAIIGSGVGPIESPAGADCLSKMCARAELVCVRDPESRDIIVKCGGDPARISVTGDWAAELCPEDIPEVASMRAAELLPPDDGRPLVALHLAPFSKSVAAAASVIELVHNAIAAKRDARLVWIFENRDRRLSTVLRAAKLFSCDFIAIPRQPYWVTAALLRRMSLILTSQLHVAIVGWALGVPVCGFSSHPKTKRFFSQIGRAAFQVDHQDDLAPIEGWVRAWSHAPDSLADSEEKRRLVRQGASRNHEAIRMLISGN